jgi:hypothetical protein
MLRALAIVVGTALLGLVLLPFLVVGVLAGQLQQAAQAGAQWDIPPAVLPALEQAGGQAGVPWFLLAAVASVATDFARHAPDEVARGDAPGTTIFPVVTPPIGAGPGQGMFLLGRGSAPAALGNPQDVLSAAAWLAGRLADLTAGDPLAQGALGDPEVDQFWERVLAQAPLSIAAAAITSDEAPVMAGDDPIQQFGAAVLIHIAAPVTATNLGAFAAWAAGEGTCARFNPLATTQPEPGATPFNTLSGGGHVWNYPSMDVGVQATTTALTNGRYQRVIAAFQADAGVDAVATAVEASPWGTRHFGSPTYAGRSCGQAASSPAPTPSTVSIVATIVARASQYQSIWSDMELLGAAGAPIGAAP